MKFSATLAAATLVLFMSLASSVGAADASRPKFGERNMGTVDRVIRATVGTGLAVWGGVLVADDNSRGYIPLGISAVPFLTAAIARCPLYYPFGIDTRDKPKSNVSVLLSPKGDLGLMYSYNF